MKKDRSDWVFGTYKVEDQTEMARREYRAMTPQERISLVQELREMFYGDDATLPRLQRLLANPESVEGPVYGYRRLGSRIPRVAEEHE